jgi:hypothetical protein
VPTRAIEALIIGLSALLLLFTWSNAAAILLIAFLTSARRVLHLLPLRPLCRALFALGIWIREKRRDHVFAAQMSRYERRKAEFLAAASPKIVDYCVRREAFESARTLTTPLKTVYRYLGEGVLPESTASAPSEDSEWWNILETYGLVRLSGCVGLLQILVQSAPMDFVQGDWRKHYARVQQFLADYGRFPDDGLVEAIDNWNRYSSEPNRQEVANGIRARLATIPSHRDEIAQLKEELESQIKGLARKQTVLTDSTKALMASLYSLKAEATEYFRQTEAEAVGFREPAPIRRARDSELFTSVLGLLARAGGRPTTGQEKAG